MSILESKISNELLSKEGEMGPVREKANNEMNIYGDTSFINYILKTATYYSLEHAVHLSAETRRDLYTLLKLNT